MNKYLHGAARLIFRLFPKNNKKIIFESNSDFTDNSRAIYEYMIKNRLNERYKLVWCVSEPEKFSHIRQKNVRFTSFRERKYLLSCVLDVVTAKTIFYTHAPPPMADTTRQNVVCLWHGTPLKLMQHAQTKYDPFTFISSASQWCSDSLCDCFRVKESMVKITGYPRCDLLFETEEISAVKQKLGIDFAGPIVLWMPTFRRSTQLAIYDSHKTKTGLPLIEDADLLQKLNQKLVSLGQFMVIKLHPLQDLSDINLVELSNIKMLTNDELGTLQLYHLVGCADVLLTDYSSVYFDYLLLNRPVGFIIDDIYEYTSNRGFVTDRPFEFMPGALIETVDDLYNFLADTVGDGDNDDVYAGERARVNAIANFYKDFQSCERILGMLNIK